MDGSVEPSAPPSSLIITSRSGQRAFPRIAVQGLAVIDGTEYSLRDISGGGFALAGDGPVLHVGAVADVSLRIISPFELQLDASARVAHLAHGRARGFQFQRLPPNSGARLVKLINDRLMTDLSTGPLTKPLTVPSRAYQEGRSWKARLRSAVVVLATFSVRPRTN